MRCPSEGLGLLGVQADSVSDVIITHMHYDHCGNSHLFQGARYHLQDKEMQYATGRCMCHRTMRYPFSLGDVMAMVERLYTDRVVFHDGAEEIAPGISASPRAGTPLACRWCGFIPRGVGGTGLRRQPLLRQYGR